MEIKQASAMANAIVDSAKKSGKTFGIFMLGSGPKIRIHSVETTKEGFSIRCDEMPERFVGVYNDKADPVCVEQDILVTCEGLA